MIFFPVIIFLLGLQIFLNSVISKPLMVGVNNCLYSLLSNKVDSLIEKIVWIKFLKELYIEIHWSFRKHLKAHTMKIIYMKQANIIF